MPRSKAKRRAAPPQPAFTLAVTGPVRSWSGDWDALQRQHPAWRMASDTTAPLYCLPEAAIDLLGRSQGQASALLDAAAERTFLDLCNAHHAVGCWHSRPVLFSFLTTVAPVPSADQMQALGWGPHEQLLIQRLTRESEETALRLKGYAGWLLTEPAFLEQTRQLAERWNALPEAQRPVFPLGRLSPLPASLFPLSPSAATSAFQTDLRAMLDRWGLTQLATWDLPQPQGPLLPNPLPPGAPALPAHGVHLVLPLHYPLQGDDNLMRRVLEFQRQFARDQGLDESLAGLAHHRAYAEMFDLLHLERSIRSRAAGHAPRGFVTRVEQALAAGLDISLDAVRQHRKAIAACRRGRRSQIRRLRPRTR